ncbi:uncharacterized protein [Parasteatoda tepidariorum]|uniref:uncharacterized protein isoform X2 n=1 Tax=Parasteatoda tepidariorum TaxID=114398 RepID=UPI00077FAFFA|nr:uncharacterized protein LOC107440714 isoform X2 [Parasteatoda tepidariorum]
MRRQLKQELGFLRKRAALKPGFDPLRNCARCLAELGRILNRGALCPRCSKKVCKDCRQFGDENHEWLCLYCFKHMQLKAISGEWMQEFSKLSVQRCAPPGDHLRKVLHESQRKSFHVMDGTDHSKSPSEDTPPQKPPRSFQHDPDNQNEKDSVDNMLAEKTTDVQQNEALPRVSPWNGIDPEPTIPVRVDKSRPLGTIDYPAPSNFRERQSSDEGHSTIGCRSRSTSSEVVDENDPVPLSRKRLSPLKKQQAIPEKSPVENQQSSVDSGVCSPEQKVDNFVASPLAASTHLSTETVECPSNRPRLFAQRLVNRSSSDSEIESEEGAPNKKSDILFRKVTLKKRKASPCIKPLEKKHSAASAAMIPKPFSGLTKSSFKNNNLSSNNYSKTNFKLTLPSNNNSNNLKPKLISAGVGLGVKKRSMLPISYSKTYADACAGRCPAVNTEAQLNGVHRKEESRIPSLQKLRVAEVPTKLPYLKFKKNFSCQASSVKKESSSTSFLCRKKTMTRPCFVRRASLPNRRNPSYDWLQTCSWKCHSLEDWLWHIEEQPYVSRKLSHVSYPDDYKLVYVSSSTSDENISDLNSCEKELRRPARVSKLRTSVQSRIKINCGTSYIEDSDWELETGDSDVSNTIPVFNRFKTLKTRKKCQNSVTDVKICNEHDFTPTIKTLRITTSISDIDRKQKQTESKQKNILNPTKSNLFKSCSYFSILHSHSKIKTISSKTVFPTIKTLELTNISTKINTAACYSNDSWCSFSSYDSPLNSFRVMPISELDLKQSTFMLFAVEDFIDRFLCAKPPPLSNSLSSYSNEFSKHLISSNLKYFSEFSYLFKKCCKLILQIENNIFISCFANDFKTVKLVDKKSCNQVFSLSTFTERLKLSLQTFFIFVDISVNETLRNKYQSQRGSLSHYFELFIDFFKQDRFPVISCSEFYFLLCGEFYSLDRSRCFRIKEESHLNEAANAFPPNLSKRGNDKSAVTGWRGERQCCIERVIDLNLRALECDREVLDLADLTLYLGWTAGTSSSAKHGVPASVVNTFFYRIPPVALKAEAGCLLQTTHSRLLFQRDASGESRMIALKTNDTSVQVENENNFYFWDYRKKIDAMQSEKEDSSSITEASFNCESISHSNNASRLKKQNMRLAIVSEMSSVDVNKLNSKRLHAGRSIFSNIDLNGSDVTDSDSEILPYIRCIFSSNFGENSPVRYFDIFSVENVDIIERVDCRCNKPCDVPSSPSVVDATLDARGLADDGEIFSSGDELDKLESDTDSQDTVIEGEAYKRIRSVAIKEKILHANEELFGATLKETFFENGNATSEARNCSSKNIENSTKEASYFIEDNQSDSLNLECGKYFSIEKQLKSFMKENQSAFQPENELSDCTNEFIQLSSYKTNFSENVCSSESSDNGSDGEELVFSDISTSSDEATYIAPSASFHCYPVSHRLHTIVEESCEESEKSSTPTSKASSDFEYYDKSRLASSKAPRKYFRKSVSDNASLGKGSAVYAVLATSRLEKYFKSGLLEGEHVSYLEDELTDESGGISSDDENVISNQKDKSKVNKTSSSKKLGASSSETLRKCTGKLSQNSESLVIETKPGSSDDEAKYIMSHLMQHISNNDAKTVESEIKDMSPMLKILESEIARLMLTVSPASLSAGEPSSSCSSTIGSNNSDYGSDTLESGEESTDDELSNENRAVENTDSVSDHPADATLENNSTADSSEETLYICKQLMASLKKIADSSDGVVAPEEPIPEDNSAKQYITDQIVSLMQTVSASHNNSPLLDLSDSDSPPPNDEKREKSPSESGSETTISASISIPSYDDSDRTPTESEISHEMDELYALLESNHELISSKFSYDAADTYSLDKESPEESQQSSLLCGAASKLESLLPISIEERIARYKDAFLNRSMDCKEKDFKASETRINVILPQPASSDSGDISLSKSLSSKLITESKPGDLLREESSSHSDVFSHDSITSVKIISHNTYPLSSAIHKILSSNIDSQYLEHKLDYKIVNILDDTPENPSLDEESSLLKNDEGNIIVTSLPKVMNPKEKASSENDLLVANYRAKTKGNFGTKSVGNISELEKSTFRDTGYYSFKSSEESFLSFDDSTETSTASLTQYRSLTSTETIPEEEESVTKMSLSSSNIPDAVCGTSPSKSSTLPLSLRSKLSATPHRTRSSFFSTSGVLRKLTLLRDESGNSLRSSPHGRLRMRNRSLSGGSEDAKHRKTSLPQISVSECAESQVGRLSAASSEKESSGVQEDEIDQAFAYHCRSQMSLSSFGGRCESVTSVYSAAGGGRYGTVTVTGEVLFGLSYNYKASTLEIIVKECRNLAAVDIKRNRSDPYVKVYLLPDRTKSGKRKTKVKKHTLSPVFDERLKFSIMPSEMEIRTLWLSVWHSDRFGRNDFLGEVMLPLGNDTFENNGLKWYPLQERMETLDTPVSYKGDLILALKYVPPDVTSRKFSKKPGIPVKGAVEVLVKEARNLMATRSNGTSDPFCKSYLLPDKTKSGKQKTPVLKKSCNPKWNHTFVYDDVTLDDLRERCLELTIWDYDKITSNDFLGGVRLCLGTGKYQGRDVDWMDSVGEERSLWYTMLERPNTWVEGSLLLRPNMQNRKSL